MTTAPTPCGCDACKDGTIHASDCAVHNAPALSVGLCDCSAGEIAGLQAEIERLTGALAASEATPTTIPADVLRALDRMCTPLHESHLKGATAEADAHCMKIIRDYIFAASEARDVGVSDAEIIAVLKNIDGWAMEHGLCDSTFPKAVAAVRKLFATRASEAAPAQTAWVSVDERLPVAGKPVLFSFLNALGKRRTARGYHAPHHTLSANDWEDPDDADTDEQENYWVPEGWWEDPVEIEGMALVRQPVTHWTPLPASPDALASQAAPDTKREPPGERIDPLKALACVVLDAESGKADQINSYASVLRFVYDAVAASQAAPSAPDARRLETASEHIARDMKEGRFPERSEPQMLPSAPDTAKGEPT